MSFAFVRSLVCVVTLALGAAAQAQVVAGKDRFGDAMRIGLPLAAAALSLAKDDTEGLQQLAMSTVLSAGRTALLTRAKPIWNTTTDCVPDGSSVSVNDPSSLVSVRATVPSTSTRALGIGVPFAFTTLPRRMACPSVGAVIRDNSLRRVDLPAPFLPITPRTSPRPSSKEIWRRTQMNSSLARWPLSLEAT